MASSIRSGRFSLQAMISGKTLDVEVRLLTGTDCINFLWQYFSAGGSVSPDYETGTRHPKFYAQVRDTATGRIYPTVSDDDADGVALIWQGDEVTFGSDGKSTGAWAGYFTRSSQVVDGVRQRVFEIVKNIAGGGNEDADTFHLVGSIVTENNNVQNYTSAAQTFEVYKMSDTSTEDYRVVMTVNDVEEGSTTGRIRAQLYSVAAQDFVKGITAKWYNLDGLNQTEVTTVLGYTASGGGTANDYVQLEIPASAVEGEDTYKVVITYLGKEYVGTAYIQDLTDGFVVECEPRSGVEAGYLVKENDTAIVDIRCVKRSDRSLYDPNMYANLALFRDATTLTPVTAGTYTYDNPRADGKGTLTMTYANLVAEGGRVEGYITIDATKS